MKPKNRPMRESAKKRQKAFLREYVKCGGKVHIAAAALGFTPRLHINWVQRPDRYPEYAAAFRKARRAARKVRARVLSEAVYERAVKGAPRYGKNKNGALVSEWWSESTGYVTADDHRFIADPSAFVRRTVVEHVPSDNLAMFELKKLVPAYREKQQVSLTGKDGGPVQTQTTHTFDHAKFADLYRSRTRRAGDGAGAAAAYRN